MNTTPENINHSVILFDGLCNLCSKSVQFVIKRDKNDYFRFASLQSSIGEALASRHGLQSSNSSSFILIEGNKAYTRSTGALRVARKLSKAWPLLYGFIIIPAFIRDAIYNIVAVNRYKWFGKKSNCWLPSSTLENKFL